MSNLVIRIGGIVALATVYAIVKGYTPAWGMAFALLGVAIQFGPAAVERLRGVPGERAPVEVVLDTVAHVAAFRWASGLRTTIEFDRAEAVDVQTHAEETDRSVVLVAAGAGVEIFAATPVLADQLARWIRGEVASARAVTRS